MSRPNLLACPLALVLAASAASPTVDAAQKGKSRKATATSPACVDFYSHANAGWLQANAHDSGTAPVSAMGQLRLRARQQQAELLDAAMAAPRNEVQKALGDLWASGLDEAAIEREGTGALTPLFAQIDKVRKAGDVAGAIAILHQAGIPVAFDFRADIDRADPTRHVGHFSQGGLGLPDPAFYTRGDTGTRAVLAQYNAYVQRLLVLSGTPTDKAAAQAQQVIDLETRIARASRPLKDLRDPRAEPAHVPLSGLDKTYRKLDLSGFLQTQGVSDTSAASIADSALFAQLDKLVGSLKPAQWKAYLRWRVADAMAPYLPKAWRDAHFDFHGRLLAGQAAPPDRRDAVLDAVNLAAGPVLAREYVAARLRDATRSRAADIADDVREALGAAIDADPRLGAQARSEARAKLAALRIEIGDPRDDLELALPGLERGSFAANMLAARAWRQREEIARIGRRDAAPRWPVLPQQPALVYDLAHNRLVVTAAALQVPILDASGELPSQYGAFGALVGRELHHVIDDKGRLVDARGAWRDWWTSNETAAWDALASRVAAQYAENPAQGQMKVDGKRVSAVAIADHAGVELAWAAFNKARPDAGKEARQAFYTGWARLWPQQHSDAASAVASRYPPGQWRANGPLLNQPGFGEAFGCKAATPMQAAAAQRISLWPSLPAEPAKK